MIHFHFHQFACLSLSSVPEAKGLREKGYFGSQRGVVSLHCGGSLGRLRQPAGVERRLEQPGAGSHSWEVEGKGQPRLLGEGQIAESSCAVLKKHSFGKPVLS